MPSLCLSRLSVPERQELIKKLYEIQNGKCFICEESIDLSLHKDTIDIDHIIPIKMNGPDNPSNFALTHSSCNRSKQDSDLNVAKILVKFENIKQSIIEQGRGVNLGDILSLYNGAKYSIKLKIEKNGYKRLLFHGRVCYQSTIRT
ncbi:MAG: HNH endonuclease signature motif containing protein [candidate division WOR-3 bacterium]